MDGIRVLIFIWSLVMCSIQISALQHTRNQRSLVGGGGGGFYEYASGGFEGGYGVGAQQTVPLVSNIQTVQQVPVIANIQTVQQVPVWQTPQAPLPVANGGFGVGGGAAAGGLAGFGVGGGFNRHRESLIIKGRGFGLGGLGGGRFKLRYANSGGFAGGGAVAGGGGFLGGAGGAGGFLG